MDDNFININENPNLEFNPREEFTRYFNFWPYFLCSLLVFLLSAFLYLRYAVYHYKSTAAIEIVDEAQDSEMALPTSLTVFNRSMINLENEINILKSFSLNNNVVNDLAFNIEFYTNGIVKTSQNHPDDWFKDYKFQPKNNFDQKEISFLILELKIKQN